MLKILFGVALLFLGACAQKNVISQVNQYPLFTPSQLGYATRDGGLPLEIHGAPPSGLSTEQLAAVLHLPGTYATAHFFLMQPAPPANGLAAADQLFESLCLQRVLDPALAKSGGTCHGPSHMVLVFYPHFQTRPDMACEDANKIVTGNGQDVQVMAAFCIGNRLAASGQVRVPAAAATPDTIARSINLLLSDMLQARQDGGRASDHRGY